MYGFCQMDFTQLWYHYVIATGVITGFFFGTVVTTLFFGYYSMYPIPTLIKYKQNNPAYPR
jgi:hypothetical protein